MKKILFMAFLVLAFSVLLEADVYIKSNRHTDAYAMMGKEQPAQDDITEQWFGNNKLADITGVKVFIMDMNKNVMFIINLKEKSYVETTLPPELSKLVPKEASKMLAMTKVTVKVMPNGQTKKINSWNCSGYDVDMNMMMMPMKMKVWATTDVSFDWKLFAKMYANYSKMQFFDDNAINEFKKIKGFQVASEMTMNVMGANMKVTTRVVEITQKPAPAGVYAVPPGFIKKDSLSLKDLRSGK